MKKLVLILVVAVGLFLGCDPIGMIGTNPEVTPEGSTTKVDYNISRAMDIALDHLVDPYERKEQKDKVFAIVEKTPELYEKSVQDFKAVIKASFDIIDGSFDNKTKEAAKKEIKKAYDDGKGSGFKSVASIVPTTEEEGFYELIKPWVYSTAHEDYLKTAEELLKFYRSNKHNLPGVIGTNEYKDFSYQIIRKKDFVDQSYRIQVPLLKETQEAWSKNLITPVYFPERLLPGATYGFEKIIDDLLRDVETYYNDYILETYGIDLDAYFEGKVNYSNEMFDYEDDLAVSKEAPVMLMAIYRLWVKGNRRIMPLPDHARHRGASDCKIIPDSVEVGSWDLTRPYNIIDCLDAKIKASKEVIKNMKIVREALDVMFK